MSDFVAKQDIGDPGRGVFAYRRGQTVTAAAVERGGWQEFVVGANTKEARQIRAELVGEQVEGDQGVSASSPKSSERKGS